MCLDDTKLLFPSDKISLRPLGQLNTLIFSFIHLILTIYPFNFNNILTYNLVYCQLNIV